MNDESVEDPTPSIAGSDPSSDIEAEIRRQVLAEQQARAAAFSAARPLSAPPTFPASAAAAPAPAKPGLIARWKSRGGILGAIATVLAWLGKLKGLLVALKFFGIFKTILITGGSMLVSMWFYAKLYGWEFGAAIVAMIFLHECGHAFAGHLKGRPWGIMMFVPGMGAFVTVRGGRTASEDAFIGIAGPIAGTLCGLAAWGAYFVTGNGFWLAVANFTFFMNLFNLAPVAPLDGGWIVPLFSPRILAITAVLLIPLGFLNPLIFLLALLSLPRIIGGWNAAKNAKNGSGASQNGGRYTSPAYFKSQSADRWRYGLLYVGLIALLAASLHATGGVRRLPRQVDSARVVRPFTPTQADL
jgi:hypothetical protein